MSRFTHFDENGAAIMVDVSDKDITTREAVATGKIYLSDEAYELVILGKMKKGDVFAVARIAGIMGAKKTSELIPLCHPIPINSCNIDFDMDDKCKCITVNAFAKTDSKTGVEMEALTAVHITLLTIYDMCKAVDKEMRIDDIHLVSKIGGKSGDFKYKGV